MLPRERVLRAVEFRPPDRVPIQVHASPGGLYEHGGKLLDLIRACPSDFGEMGDLTLPSAPPEDFDPDGTYHRIAVDPWGVTWEYTIFGIWGHPLKRPLDDYGKLAAYRPPLPPALSGAGFEAAKARAARHRETYYHLSSGAMIWETLHFLRPYEDCLVEILLDTPEINRVADMLTDYAEGCVRYGLALGTDAVVFADDFGTQLAPIFPPDVWRRFFRPRYERLFAPVREAGKKIFFHSCGQIWPLLTDLAELGVHAVWPQLPLFDQEKLARRCRELGLAVQLHPDRGELMQRGTAGQVRDYVLRLLDRFGTRSGGSWLYLEIDPGFRWENIEALFECVRQLRG